MAQFAKPYLLGPFEKFKKTLKTQDSDCIVNPLEKIIQAVGSDELKLYLPKMYNYAVFIELTTLQKELYKRFLRIVQKNDKTYKWFINNFSVFQQICMHPYILKLNQSLQNSRFIEHDIVTSAHDTPKYSQVISWWRKLLEEVKADDIKYGNKMLVLKMIIEESEKVGDKLLVLSQNRAELDFIEHLLKETGTLNCDQWKNGVDYLRIDATTLPEKRADICEHFNNRENNIRLLLMTINVAGFGFNLKAANRVVITEISWDYIYDVQSIFRVYNLGQDKPVFVYRFISMETIEETVYQYTVVKKGQVDVKNVYSCDFNSSNLHDKKLKDIPEDELLKEVIRRLSNINITIKLEE